MLPFLQDFLPQGLLDRFQSFEALEIEISISSRRSSISGAEAAGSIEERE